MAHCTSSCPRAIAHRKYRNRHSTSHPYVAVEWQIRQASGHPSGRGRRKYKSPAAQAAVELPWPHLPDQLDESSDGDAEKDTKRHRSTSTTPKSGKRLQQDEWNRLIGIGSVESTFEEEKDGDGEMTAFRNSENGSCLTTQQLRLTHVLVL